MGCEGWAELTGPSAIEDEVLPGLTLFCRRNLRISRASPDRMTAVKPSVIPVGTEEEEAGKSPRGVMNTPHSGDIRVSP